jgi:hypothetical protein
MDIVYNIAMMYCFIGALFGAIGFVLYFIDWKGTIGGKVFHGLSRSFVFFIGWPFLLLVACVFLFMLIKGIFQKRKDEQS